MPKRIKVSDISKSNPQVNERELKASIELCRALRRQGIKRKEYDIVPPYGGRSLVAMDKAEIDRALNVSEVE